MTDTKSKTAYYAFIILFSLIAFEVLLRLFHVNITWSEKIGRGYASYYNKSTDSWFNIYKPHADFDMDNGDFKYHYTINSIGLREREDFFKDSSKQKIIVLGDSYTEGAGTSYDSSYPRFIERALNLQQNKYEILNAGVSGSDPFFEYMLFKEKLLQYHPQYVLINFNSSDISDYIYRGGMERFKADGTSVFKKGPWYEPLYQYSYVFRFILNNILRYTHTNLFLTRHQYQDVVAPQALKEITALLDTMNAMGKKNNFKLLLTLQPVAVELAYKKGDNAYSKTIFERFKDSAITHNIAVVNLWPVMETEINKQNMYRYTYKHDGHYNGDGYALVANAIIKLVNEQYPQFWQDSIAH